MGNTHMEHSKSNFCTLSNNNSNEKIEIELTEFLPKLAVTEAALSVTNHPMWSPLWDAKAARFNALAEQMEKAGVDLQLLDSYRSAMEQLAQLEAEHAHDTGFMQGAIAMATPESDDAQDEAVDTAAEIMQLIADATADQLEQAVQEMENDGRLPAEFCEALRACVEEKRDDVNG